MSQPNQITYLVNNSHPFPDGYNVIRNDKGLPEHDFYNQQIATYDTTKNNIVAFIDSNCWITNPDVTDIVVSAFEENPEATFIYTDLLMLYQEQEMIDHFSGMEIPDAAFFMNLNFPILFPAHPQCKLQTMQQLTSQGKLFVHIPDPLLTAFKQ